MAELWEVVEVLARSAATAPGWSGHDAKIIAEWIDGEKPVEKPASSTTSTSKGGK